MTKLIYGAIALVTIIGFVIVTAPAATVWSMIGSDIETALPGMKISNLKGSVWNGEGLVQFQSFPTTSIDWRLAALPLLAGNAAFEISARASDFDADVSGVVTGHSGTINDATVTIGSEYINSVTLDYGLDLSREFHIEIDGATFADGWPTAVEGNIRWPGGVVHIETPEQVHTVRLPELTGDLFMDEGKIHLNVVGDDEPLIDVSLNRTGWAEVGITYAFMRLANLPLPTGSESQGTDEIAILLEEKIL